MKITVADRRAVSAEATVEMVEAYLLRTGWGQHPSGVWQHREPKMAVMTEAANAWQLAGTVEFLAKHERRAPSEVLSDIVGYRVGLDRGRASVLRNSASAHVVEAREALAAAETALKAKPKKADRIAAVEAARVRLAQAEANLAAATRALEAATSSSAT